MKHKHISCQHNANEDLPEVRALSQYIAALPESGVLTPENLTELQRLASVSAVRGLAVAHVPVYMEAPAAHKSGEACLHDCRDAYEAATAEGWTVSDIRLAPGVVQAAKQFEAEKNAEIAISA